MEDNDQNIGNLFLGRRNKGNIFFSPFYVFLVLARITFELTQDDVTKIFLNPCLSNLLLSMYIWVLELFCRIQPSPLPPTLTHQPPG